MYKKQMIFQRVVCFIVLAASVIVFIYSLGLLTDIYQSLGSAVRVIPQADGSVEYRERVTGARIYYDMQEFNSQLTMVGIGLILASLVLFIFGTNSRRKYYIGNFFSVAVSLVACCASAVWALPIVGKFRDQYLTTVDFAGLKTYAEDWNSPYIDSTFWFDAGYVAFAILAVANVLLVVNLVLKLILMKAEKSTIGSGKDVVR